MKKMDLDLTSQTNESFLKKHLFSLKASRSDGLLLQVHHTFASSGELVKSRIIHAAFNDSSTHIAAADHNGKIFIIDLQAEKYWQLPNVGSTNFISFPVFKKSELLISLQSAVVQCIDIETGNPTGYLSGHSFPPTDISYTDDGRFCLTSCSTEAIIWDLQTNTQAYRLSVKVDSTLKKVLFMPVSNNIIACFQDDAMHIWKFGSFECIKQIIPESWKTHHLKTIALTRNGRAMVIGGHTPSLVVFCLDTWVVKKIIEFPESIPGVKQIEFVPQIFDGGANKILALLTNSLGIYFLDIETSMFLKSMHKLDGLAAKLCISPTGKYFASLLISGEVNIYTTLKVLEGDLSRTPVEIERSGTGVKSTSVPLTVSSNQRLNYKNKLLQSTEALSSINKQIKETLTLKKLLPILKEFGEYPDSYRVLIWKTVLQLPMNQEAYRSLSSKECYPSYASLESQYPLVNKSLLNLLKRLLSSLSHWCPLFGEVGFLPEFVFPFVKVFHFDPFACFEAVATIIVNWCQNWFEFYPFPPINTLAMIENVLAYHDPDLLEFYFKESVTSSLYACTLLQTVLSEVLSKNEWLRLWDHVISNEPAFLLMAVVAYNVVCRNAIKSCESAKDIEMFFHNQIAIDMKMLISKCYYFLDNTPEEIHPRQYLAPFRPLPKGGAYAAYEGYPKIIVDPNARKLHDIHKEEEEILREQRKAIAIKKELDKRLQNENRVEVREEILKELDEKFRKIVDEEEERILAQRRKLQNLRQELKLKELAVLESARERNLKLQAERKKIELQRLVNDISKKKALDKVELDLAESEIKKYHSELLSRKCQLESELKFKDLDTSELAESLRQQHQKLKAELNKLQNETATLHHSKHIEITSKVAAIKDLLQNVELEIAKEIAEKDVDACVEQNRMHLVHLKEETKALEEKVEDLLNKQLHIQDFKKSLNSLVERPRELDENFSVNVEDCRTRWSVTHHESCQDAEMNTSGEVAKYRLMPYKNKSKSMEALREPNKNSRRKDVSPKRSKVKTKSKPTTNVQECKKTKKQSIKKGVGDRHSFSENQNISSFSDSNGVSKFKRAGRFNQEIYYAFPRSNPYEENECKCTAECNVPCTSKSSSVSNERLATLKNELIYRKGLRDFDGKKERIEIRSDPRDKDTSSEYHSATNESESRCSICQEKIDSAVKRKSKKKVEMDRRKGLDDKRMSYSEENLHHSCHCRNVADLSITKSASEDEVVKAAMSIRRRLIDDAKRFTTFTG